MAKKDYSNYSKEELIKIIHKLEKKSYGLVWEDKPELLAQECKTKLPVITEDKNKEIQTNKDEPTNIIIEGDNYHALWVLNYTHRKKIDVIYIDPPYNTGNKTEWKYNDKYIDENDGYRHSKWLNMMEKRLLLAKNLLKDGASIFISIGDDEQANLKLLCDKIFGRENFITNISRIAKTASNKGKYFAPSCDYILLYTKSVEKLDDDSFSQDVNEDLYKKEDEFGKYRDDVAFYQSSLDPLRGCTNQRYYVEAPDGTLLIPPGETFPDKKEDACFVPPKTKQDKVWRWSYETYLQQNDLLVFKETKTSPLLDENGNQARYNIYTKSYLKERKKTGVKPRNFLIEKEFLNRKGADYIKKIGINFNYSKPKALISYLIKLSNGNNEAIILDYFAGSGTTGEVVLDLNKEDKGKRKFILCTNNEVGLKEESEFRKTNNLSIEDFRQLKKNNDPKYVDYVEKNGVSTSICYPRLKSIINGYKEVSKKAPFIEGLGGNLKYYRTDFVPFAYTDSDKRALTNKSTEMLCLAEETYDEILFKKGEFSLFENESKITAIIYDEDFIESCKAEIKKHQKPITIYVFSYDKEYNPEDFDDLEGKIKIKPIPEAILNIYKKISRK